MTAIIGAGLAGLLAGNIFQRAKIIEAGPEDQLNHKAVLRFRSSAVGDAIGVDFRKVTVHKGVFINNRFVAPTIQLANLYSRKVIDKLADRSIWKLDPVERFIAPPDLVAQMAERCAGRIEWNTSVDHSSLTDLITDGNVVSTMPMNVMAPIVGAEEVPTFSYAPIVVRRWRVRGADVFQTVYFPSPETSLYRASITGDLLIAEYRDEADNYNFFNAFGLSENDCEPIDSAKQRYGKIAPIDEQWRRNFILNASRQYGIYSLGRFATWRNVLMDDVLKDVYVVKRLMSGDHYTHSKHAFAGGRS
jgi:hypothetical protein